MKAVVIEAPGRFVVTDVPDPVPGPREVVVEVAAVGVCGTDLHVLDGEFAPTEYPIVPGHETSGTVAAVGEDVTEVAVGDPVAVDPTLTCGECSFCAIGRSNLCERWDGSGVARTDGSCSELVLAPVRNVHRLPAGVDLHRAALIEPLSCAVHGFDLLPRRLGDHHLVYGAGTMGLMMAQLASRAGAATVTVVDPNPGRREAATEVGLDRVVGHADEADRPGGFDVVIDCTGAVAAIEDGLTRVRRGGVFQQFGVAPTDARATFSPFAVYHDEISVVGSMAVLHSFGRAVELFAAGAIRAEPMITHAYGLDDYGAAIERFRSGTARKIQIRPAVSGELVLR